MKEKTEYVSTPGSTCIRGGFLVFDSLVEVPYLADRRQGEFSERHPNFPLEPMRIRVDFDALHGPSRTR
jgi:hypothetical protein